MEQLTLGSLFDGIGGWQIAAVRNGILPVWSSEIEPYPMAVTKHHFPATIQLGDITKLQGDKLPPVDIICAGSPCQDLSVAGRQKGLQGERSGLFYQSIQLFYAMRRATGGRYPRYFIWENVPGAFSSNNGQDFRCVLEEIGQAGLPMPEPYKWAKAGLVELPECQIAWRVLDAQYWGVPQRRARIFLVADFAAEERRAAEMLFVEAGLQRDPRPCREPEGETTPAGTPRGTREAGRAPVTPAFCISGNVIGRKVQNGGHHLGVDSDVAFTLNTVDHHAVYAETYAMRRSDHIIRSDLATCLAARDYKGIQSFVSYPKGKLASGRDCTGALCANASTKQWMGNQEAFSGDYFLLEHETEEDARTVRRLTVTECERLQGLPDGWTDVPVNGRPARESERIKAIGNGMAQPCADFVLQQLAYWNN